MKGANQAKELVINRLKKERKEWRSDHPYGFVAKPKTNNDGTLNLLKWVCEIPGPDGPWHDGVYHLTMDFSHDYPVRYPFPKQTPQVRLRASPAPSQHLPLGHGLPLDPQRRGGLEAQHHGQDHPPGHPEAAEG